MKYGVLLDARESRAKVLRCPDDAKILQTCYDVIGCRLIENMILEPGRLPEGYAAFADEDLYEKLQVFNLLASWIHGADVHGQTICNNVIIWKEIPEDVDFMTEEEARKICNDLNALDAKEIFIKMVDTVFEKTNSRP